MARHLTRREFIGASAAVGAGVVGARMWLGDGSARASVLLPQVPLPGSQIPQFAEPLPTFVGSRVDSSSYTTTVQEFQQIVLPSSVYANLPSPFNRGTYVWGLQNGTQPAHWPGHTTIAHRGTPTTATYVNNIPLPGRSQLEPRLTIDQTLSWANPLNTPPSREPYQGVIPVVFHLHGMEVNSEFDGTMMEWFTQNGIHGPGYNTLHPTRPNAAVYRYPNTQPPCTLFFHDHTRGITHDTIYAGMVSQYWLRDQFDTGAANNPLRLPAGNFEIELTIQDRMFDTNGQLLYPDNHPSNAAVHPFWGDNFFGDVICVNGRSWPFLEVEPRRYRFRMLSFANMRTFRVWLEDTDTQAPGPPIWEIGTDGGLLDRPVKLSADPNDNAVFGGTKLFLVVTERADVIIDFTGMEGRTFTLRNDAATPFADTEHTFPLDPAIQGRIMQFRVNRPLSSPDFSYNPASGAPLRGGRNQLPAIIRLADPTTGQPGPGVTPSVHRQLIFRQFEPPSGTVEYLINNTIQEGVRQGTNIVVPGSEPTRQGGSAATDHTGMRMTEVPRVGDTEVWEVLNLTEEAHA
ncbi:MAG: hypothetical protein J2P17_30090, partial [Mycobacterium sp.]|nr:hypothetical protein [Mycobacterium sp.]